MEYQEFIKSKKKEIILSGFDIESKKLNKNLSNFQEFTVKRAIKHGKYAIFADTGQGKTFMQIEIGYQVAKKENKPVLILAPLAVTGQTIKEGIKWGYEIEKLVNK